MFLTYCNACKQGDHNHHQKVIRAAPPGMMGGVGCRCEGECRDFTAHANDIVAEMTEALSRGVEVSQDKEGEPGT